MPTLNKPVIIILLITVIFLATIFLGAFYAALYRPNVNLKKTEIVVGGTTFGVDIASTTISRARGLSGREGLSEGEGLLFLFDGFGNYGFWMKDMKFPIDIIWIKDNYVVGFAENVAPEPGKALWSLKFYYPPEPVNKVLEVSAGSVKKYGIKIGDGAIISEASN